MFTKLMDSFPHHTRLHLRAKTHTHQIFSNGHHKEKNRFMQKFTDGQSKVSAITDLLDLIYKPPPPPPLSHWIQSTNADEHCKEYPIACASMIGAIIALLIVGYGCLCLYVAFPRFRTPNNYENSNAGATGLIPVRRSQRLLQHKPT